MTEIQAPEELEAFCKLWHRQRQPKADELVAAWLHERGSSVIDTVPITARAKPAATCKRLEAALLRHSAATTNGSTPRYMVAAIAAGGRLLAQHPVRIGAGLSLELCPAEGNPVADDPSVSKQLVKSAMQQSTQMHRLVLGSVSGMFATFEKMHSRLMTRLDTLEGTQVEMMRATQDILSAALERDLVVKTAEQEVETRERLWRRFDAISDVAIAQMTGSTPAAKLIQSFSPEQFNSIVAGLNDEQRALMADMLRLDQKADAATKKLASGQDDAPTEQSSAASGSGGSE